MTQKLEDKRVLPRFPLQSEQVKIHFDSYARIFALRDLSMTGMGIDLLEHGDVLLFPEGQVYSSELHLHGEWFPLQLRVARNGAASVGFSLVDPSDDLRERIERFLDPIRIGRSFKKISMENAPEAFGEGITCWFHGESNSDLYLCESADGQLYRFLLTWNGLFCEWSDPDGLRTGELEHAQGSRVLLHYEAQVKHSTIYQGRKILENASILAYRLADQMQRHMSSN